MKAKESLPNWLKLCYLFLRSSSFGFSVSTPSCFNIYNSIINASRREGRLVMCDCVLCLCPGKGVLSVVAMKASFTNILSEWQTGVSAAEIKLSLTLWGYWLQNSLVDRHSAAGTFHSFRPRDTQQNGPLYASVLVFLLSMFAEDEFLQLLMWLPHSLIRIYYTNKCLLMWFIV